MAYFAIDYYIREGSANSSGPPKWKQWIFVFLHYQEVQGLFMLTFKTQILSLVSVFASQILPTSTEWQRSDGNISRMCLHAVWALWESTGTRGARTETRPSCCFLSCTGQRSPVPTCLCSFIQNAAVTSLNEALRFDEVTLPGLLLFFFFFLSYFTVCFTCSSSNLFLIFHSSSAELLYFELSQPLSCFLEEECSVTAQLKGSESLFEM